MHYVSLALSSAISCVPPTLSLSLPPSLTWPFTYTTQLFTNIFTAVL